MEWKKNDKARYELGLEVGSSNTNAMGSRGGGRGEKAWSRQGGGRMKEKMKEDTKSIRERGRESVCVREERKM